MAGARTTNLRNHDDDSVATPYLPDRTTRTTTSYNERNNHNFIIPDAEVSTVGTISPTTNHRETSQQIKNINDVKTMSKSKKFKPYSRATLDSPFFHFIIEPMLPALRPILSQIYAIRWQMSRPLQIKVLPNWFPASTAFHSLSLLTFGQVLLGFPLLVIFLAGYYTTFVNPNVEKSGAFASYALLLVYITANKANSIPAFTLGISFERMIPYHNMCSIAAVLLSFGHGYVAYAYGGDGGGDGGGNDDEVGSRDRRLSSDDSQYALTGANPNLGKFLVDGDNNTSGTLLTLAMTLLVATSIFPVLRRKFFDIWFWVHIGLAICTIIFCIMHEVTDIILIALWWGLDVVLRYAVMATCRYPKKATLRLVRSDIVEVSFPKTSSFDYNPGQFVQFSVPELGVMNFHPISISSAPHEPLVTLHVRALGGWSQSLVDLAKTKSEVTILVEGPYGCLSLDVDDDSRYQMAVCVGGGIGVTHCQSVAKSLVYQQTQGRNLKKMRFVWTIRELDMLNVLSLPPSSAQNEIELLESGEGIDMHEVPLSSDDGVLQTDVFVTSKTSTSTDAEINAIMGKVDPSTNIYQGRPNLDAIFEEVKQEAQRLGVTHVAVFGCGPKRLIDALQETCRVKTDTLMEMSDGVSFDVHEEIFDF